MPRQAVTCMNQESVPCGTVSNIEMKITFKKVFLGNSDPENIIT